MPAAQIGERQVAADLGVEVLGVGVDVAGQVVTATAEAPSGKTKLEFEKKGNLLVSKAQLPAGEGYIVVVQVRTTADAKSKNFRIPLILHTCKGCNNAEYACVCDE